MFNNIATPETLIHYRSMQEETAVWNLISSKENVIFLIHFGKSFKSIYRQITKKVIKTEPEIHAYSLTTVLSH